MADTGILIPSLPEATGLSNNDYIVKDTGTVTQKIKVSNMGASASNAGFVTTGTQTIAGTKEFSGTVRISNGEQYQSITLINPVARTTSAIFRLRQLNSETRFQFIQYSARADGSSSTVYDAFMLPATMDGVSSSGTYDILTSKSPVTIAQGGTGQTATTSVTDAVTRTSGATLTSQRLLTWGKVKFLTLQLTLTEAATANSNIFVGAISADNRPATVTALSCYVSAGAVSGVLNTSGNITIRTSVALAVNAVVYVSAIFLMV